MNKVLAAGVRRLQKEMKDRPVQVENEMGTLTIAREDSEVDEVLNKCSEMENEGKNPFFGLTYAQGVEQGIRWLIGEEEEQPLSE
ncbi:hypothetical protein ES705_35501 [subsurface metagenome]